MSSRILSVNAYTTLDLVSARLETHDDSLSLDGVLNVATEDECPDRVILGIELDTVGVDAVPAHADRIELTPDQAEAVAESLQDYADDVRSASH